MEVVFPKNYETDVILDATMLKTKVVLVADTSSQSIDDGSINQIAFSIFEDIVLPFFVRAYKARTLKWSRNFKIW